jgi:hypothetical protein
VAGLQWPTWLERLGGDRSRRSRRAQLRLAPLRGLYAQARYRVLLECQAEYAKEGTAAKNVPPDYKYNQGVGSAVVAGPTYTAGR